MIDQILNFVRPPDDADPKTLKRWHWNAALMLIGGFVFAVWSWTPFGYARAQEVEKKIAAAVEPIQQQVAAVDGKVEKIAADLTYTKELLIRKLTVELEREILEAKRRQCKAQTIDTVEYFRKQVIEKLDDYRSLTKREYDVPGCAEV